MSVIRATRLRLHGLSVHAHNACIYQHRSASKILKKTWKTRSERQLRVCLEKGDLDKDIHNGSEATELRLQQFPVLLFY